MNVVAHDHEWETPLSSVDSVVCSPLVFWVYIANWPPVSVPCAGWSHATLNRFIALRCLNQTPTNKSVCG